MTQGYMLVWLLTTCACGSTPTAGGARQAAAAPMRPGAAAGNPGTAAAASGEPAVQSENPASLGTAGSGPVIAVSPTLPVSSCKAGHYVGIFSGDYHSGAWFGGAESIAFATSDTNGRPGFEFWLEAVDKPCTQGQEFCADAVVKGGKLRGNAAPFTDASDPNAMPGAGFAVRFEIDLTGELDCRTGKFKGRLENGCYDILSLLYRFNGTIEGTYSGSKSAFTQGTWHVDEMEMAGAAAASPLGGNGTWTADYKDESPPPTGAGIGLCAGQSGFDTPP